MSPLAPMIDCFEPAADVYSAREIARAAGVRTHVVRQSMARGEIPTVAGEPFAAYRDAVAAVRAFAAGAHAAQASGELFRAHAASRRSGVPLVLSSALHAGVLAALVVMTTAGLRSAAMTPEPMEQARPVRMVFLSQPGPGGGGGGGGLRQPAPPPKAQRKGTARLSSPLPKREPPKRTLALETRVEPPKPAVLQPEPLPSITAPVAAAPADVRDQSGLLNEVRSQADSRGPGQGGGVGSGTGTGIGEGDGSGIGPGSGGGMGGGPYRPGSGIQPPRLLHEVKPDYTEEARQRGVEGDVELEIVVRSNGTVGDVRVVRGLGAGLDQRAVTAVRQWRFAPARRLNAPVDVIVEVAVEFRLR